jgi:predicted amidohydrolase
MTANRAFKKRLRARMRRTGESYTAALRHVRSTEGEIVSNIQNSTFRLAVAQTGQHTDPLDVAALHAAGAEVRALMHEARERGADLIQFPEATFCFPDKHALSAASPDLGEADWSRFPWEALESELTQAQKTAEALGLWTVIGAQTRADAAARPRTSMLVFDDHGRQHAHYDERRLSRSKARYLYEPGQEPLTFALHGVTIGLASGLEVLFGNVFLEYEDAGADVVLFSTAGPDNPADADSLATSARAAARQHGLTIGYSVPTSNAPYTPAGIIGADGRWAAQAPDIDAAAIVITDVASRHDGPAREWRRAMASD